jgi:hypothetical protein
MFETGTTIQPTILLFFPEISELLGRGQNRKHSLYPAAATPFFDVKQRLLPAAKAEPAGWRRVVFQAVYKKGDDSC